MTGGAVLVVNPTAGRGRAQELLPEVAGTLRDAGVDAEILLSRDVREAHAMVHGATREGCSTLIVMGGDGMMHLGLNAVAETDGTHLGLIPAGTGNDLCRGLDLPYDDAVAAARVIAAGHARAMDVTEVNDRVVGAVVGTGFDALVNGRANAMRRPKGALRYPVALLAELRVFRPLRYRLTIDGTVRELDAMLVAIANTRCYGGGIKIAAQADPYDGQLDLTLIHRVSRARLIRLLPELYSGTFVRDSCVEQLRAREVVIEGPGLVGYGDGELVGAAPLHVRVRPAAVSVFVPG